MAARAVDYDRIAPTFDARYEDPHFGRLEGVVLAFAGAPGLRVLEAGCGTGHWLALLARAGAIVSGIDASPGMLAVARARLPNAELAQGRAGRLPWPDGHFDRVLCVNALHHFAAKRTFIAQARRVLRPGGGLMIVGLDPHDGTDRWWVYDWFEGTWEYARARHPPTAQIRQWMSFARFADEKTVEALQVRLSLPALEALASGRIDKNANSELIVLSDEQYRAGIARIRNQAHAAEARGERLMLEVDLRLWATTGWR